MTHISASGSGLVFLISQPRAGSTLLQRILAVHSQITTVSEPWVMLHPLYALRTTGHNAEYDAKLAYMALQSFLSEGRLPVDAYDDALRAFAAVLYGEYLARSGKSLFLDKTPRYYFIVADLHRLFPDARFVFLVRNPLAVLASLVFTWTKSNWCQLCAFRHDLLSAPHAILNGINTVDGCQVLSYEELVTRPEDTVRRLCSGLGIGFEQDMIEYGASIDGRFRLGDQGTVYQQTGPVSSSLENWIRLGARAQTRRFALEYLAALGPTTISDLGYSWGNLHAGIAAIKPYVREPTVSLSTVLTAPDQWPSLQRWQYEAVVRFQRYRQRGYRSLAQSAQRKMFALIRRK